MIGYKKVSLNFPNAIRSYNVSNRDITFWGHDSAIEITFVIELFALQMVRGDMSTDEQALCQTFDQNIKLIHAIAKRVYDKMKGGFHRLTVNDF